MELLIAPGHLHPVLGFTAVLCIAVAAGACGAINMWYDRDIDALIEALGEFAFHGHFSADRQYLFPFPGV